MKKMMFGLLIVFIIILTIFKVDANHLTFPLIGKTIVIDPGHGGVDQGASYYDVKEAVLTLEISLKIKNELEKLGAMVILTRDGNYDLSKPNALYRKKSDFDNRIKIINNSDTDIYLSIHLNAYPNDSYYGPQVFYTTNYPENEILAQLVQDELNKNLNNKRNIKITNSANYMYGKLNVKGLLVECGFISNSRDRLNLQKEEYQIKFAKIISQAIINYYQ